jgi:hypothetical protein
MVVCPSRLLTSLAVVECPPTRRCGARLGLGMPKRKPVKLREDMAETARRVFLESVGEAPKTLPPDERAEKNPEAVKRGAKGGKKGGPARKAKTTSDQREKGATTAALARWEKKKD